MTRARGLDAAAGELERAVYSHYTQWKGWGRHFVCGALDRDRFRGDFEGIELRDKVLLEIGFGTGALLAWAREKGALVMGCEINAQSVEAAEGENVPLVSPDFDTDGSLAPESLDIVVAYDVFEHFDAVALRSKLQALAAALRTGGLIVLRYPNGQSPFGLVPQNGDITHRIALSEMIMSQVAQGTGLETWRYRGATFARHPNFSHRLISALRAILRRSMIRIVQIAIATDVALDPVMIHILRKSEAPQAVYSPFGFR